MNIIYQKQNLTIQEAFDLAIQNQHKGNLKVAENLYKGILKIHPEYAGVYNNLGNIFLENKKFQEAVNCFEKAIQIDPNYADAHSNLGTLYKSLGESEKAKNCFEKVIQLKPNNAVAHFNLGSVLLKLGKKQEAKASLEKSIQFDSNLKISYSLLGTLLRQQKEFKKAADYFKKLGTPLGNAQFLECVYFSNEMENYNKLLNTFSINEPTNLRIAALATYVANKENIKNIYSLCKNPLNFFFSINLRDQFKFPDQFLDKLLKISETIGPNWQLKPIIKKGYQSTSNLLDSSTLEIKLLKKKIEEQIDIYRKNYKNSDEYFISKWPTKTNLYGWYIKLKKQGQLTSHIHESGWLSGVFYLKIPKPLKKNESSINLSLSGYDYPYDKNLPSLLYAPKSFDLILYPSSLFHNTIPFTSNEERHSIAFDLQPK